MRHQEATLSWIMAEEEQPTLQETEQCDRRHVQEGGQFQSEAWTQEFTAFNPHQAQGITVLLRTTLYHIIQIEVRTARIIKP